jgi:hypothetical protein
MLRRPCHKTHLRPFPPQLGMLDLHSVIFHKIFAIATQSFPVRNRLQIKTRPAKAALTFFDSILTMTHRTPEKATRQKKNIPPLPFREPDLKRPGGGYKDGQQTMLLCSTTIYDSE